MRLQTLTHSRMAAFRACPRRHWLRYELGLRRDEQTPALRIGSAFHAVLDVLHKRETRKDTPYPDLGDMPIYEQAVVAAMVNVHKKHHPPIEMVASEIPFRLPLTHRRTGRASTVWEWGGVIDGIGWAHWGNGLALVERKTTAMDIAPGAPYWSRVIRDQQISQYFTAAKRLGHDIRTVVYDVIRRPLHQPRLATPMDKRKYRKSDGRLYAGMSETDETPEEYADRLATMMLAEPEKWLQRVEIPRLQSEIDATLDDQWAVQRMIRRAQRHDEWPRNPQACHLPWRCSYLDICDRHDLETRTPDGYRRVDDIHPEITEATP